MYNLARLTRVQTNIHMGPKYQYAIMVYNAYLYTASIICQVRQPLFYQVIETPIYNYLIPFFSINIFLS